VTEQKKGAPPGAPSTTEEPDCCRLYAFFTQEWDAYHAMHENQDKDGVLKVLCQALFWLATLDEWLGKHRGAPYRSFRKSDAEHEIMSGLRYARNRAIHQFQELLYLDVASGAEPPMRLPLSPWEYRWKEAKDLPAPDKKHDDPEQREAYEGALAARSARVTLGKAREFFLRAKKEGL
jgi:hypothetical protein